MHIYPEDQVILSATETKAGDQTLDNVAGTMLEQYQENYIAQGANILNGYIALYHRIRNAVHIVSQLARDIQPEIEPA